MVSLRAREKCSAHYQRLIGQGGCRPVQPAREAAAVADNFLDRLAQLYSLEDFDPHEVADGADDGDEQDQPKGHDQPGGFGPADQHFKGRHRGGAGGVDLEQGNEEHAQDETDACAARHGDPHQQPRDDGRIRK